MGFQFKLRAAMEGPGSASPQSMTHGTLSLFESALILGLVAPPWQGGRAHSRGRLGLGRGDEGLSSFDGGLNREDFHSIQSAGETRVTTCPRQTPSFVRTVLFAVAVEVTAKKSPKTLLLPNLKSILGTLR